MWEMWSHMEFLLWHKQSFLQFFLLGDFQFIRREHQISKESSNSGTKTVATFLNGEHWEAWPEMAEYWLLVALHQSPKANSLHPEFLTFHLKLKMFKSPMYNPSYESNYYQQTLFCVLQNLTGIVITQR